MPDNDNQHDERKIRPFVKPGESLSYVMALEKRHNWPPKWQGFGGNKRERVVTPYLVVPAISGDIGVRPLPAPQALFNSSVEIVDNAGNVITMPVPGTTYTLRCRAINLGAAGAYGGMAEFYIGKAADFDAHATSPGSTMPIYGLTGFVAMPGATVTIICPKPWTPSDATEAASTIVVAVYDAFVDRVTQPFNAISDRHIGRRDSIPDFSGIWDGVEIRNGTFVIVPGLLDEVATTLVGAVVPGGVAISTIMVPHPIPEFPTFDQMIVRTLPDTLRVHIRTPPSGGGSTLPVGQYLIRMAITQSGLTVNASIYSQVGGELPSTPQDIGSGTISGGQVQIITTEYINGTPFTHNNYTLTRPNATALHFEHYMHFLMPDDPRSDMDFHGDLTRM